MDYTERELNFLLTNHQKFGLRVISDKLGRSLVALETKMQRLGIKASRICHASEEEISNLQFEKEKEFDIDFQTHLYPKQLAYWLGYFWADGYVGKHGALHLKCIQSDLDNIDHILNKVANFHKYPQVVDNRQPQLDIYIGSKLAADILVSLGKYSRSSESHQKIIEFIPKEYRLYFIRGLIDGDGNFSKSNNSWYFSVCSNYDQDWNFLQKYLQEEYNFPVKIIQRIEGEQKHSIIRNTNRTQMYNFCKKLYEIDDKIYLPRKFEKIKQIFKEIENT